jgi:predicted permease
MGWFNRFFVRRRMYDDLSEEIHQHLDEKVESLISKGMPRHDAELASRREFGNTVLLEERSREVWQCRWVESIWTDFRYAIRQMHKSPGFAILTVTLLGLGIGATTAVFSLVDTVLLKPLPYPDAGELVIPWNVPPPGVNVGGYAEIPWDPDRFHAMERESKTFRHLGAFQSGTFNLTSVGNGTQTGEPEMLEGLRVTSGFFPALGVTPGLGRVFTAEEDQPGHEHEVLLSDSVWRNRFQADPAIVGRPIDLNGAAYLVVGVMPPGFAFPRANEMPGDFNFPREAQLWVPAALPAITPRFTPSELAIIGRLQSGLTVQQAQGAMDLFSAGMDRLNPAGKGWYKSRVTLLQRQVAGDTRRPLLLMLCAVGVVLLIVCFNVASLLLTRSIGRRREFTLRAALGAGRSRVLRQLLTESLFLSTAGGVLGMAVATTGVLLVKRFGPSGIPRLHEVGADLRVFAFAMGVTFLTGIFFGLAPAIGATRVNLVESLKEGGQKSGSGASHPRLRSALVVSQIALALVLVVAAGLLIRSFYRLLGTDAGFHPEHVLTFELSLPGAQYPDRQHIAHFYQQVLPGLRAVAGVQSAAITEAVPMGGAPESTVIRVPGHLPAHRNEVPIVNYTIISPGFFNALGTPLLHGREFTDSDTATTEPVTVINQAMARTFWPREDVLGKQIIVPSQRVPMIVVGIVANIKHSSMREVAEPEMFVPYTQDVWPSMAIMQIVLRTQSDPISVIGGARNAIHALDPSLPLAKITTLTSLTGTAMARDRFSMLLLGFFGALSLILAAVGIYGVISYSVGQRTQEIGIRIALGARRENVFGMILAHALRLTCMGIGLGFLAALAVGRMMTGFLYGVKATDPLTFAAVSLFLAAVALVASLFPAHRAASIDPTQALRTE